MKPTTYNLPTDLTDKIDQVAIASERSRSFVVRKLLENALTAADRMAALNAVASEGLREFADAANAPRALNATTEVIASPESCADGHGRLAALEKIAAGRK
jgi:predicted transcriptional regulator